MSFRKSIFTSLLLLIIIVSSCSNVQDSCIDEREELVQKKDSINYLQSIINDMGDSLAVVNNRITKLTKSYKDLRYKYKEQAKYVKQLERKRKISPNSSF